MPAHLRRDVQKSRQPGAPHPGGEAQSSIAALVVAPVLARQVRVVETALFFEADPSAQYPHISSISPYLPSASARGKPITSVLPLPSPTPAAAAPGVHKDRAVQKALAQLKLAFDHLERLRPSISRNVRPPMAPNSPQSSPDQRCFVPAGADADVRARGLVQEPARLLPHAARRRGAHSRPAPLLARSRGQPPPRHASPLGPGHLALALLRFRIRHAQHEQCSGAERGDAARRRGACSRPVPGLARSRRRAVAVAVAVAIAFPVPVAGLSSAATVTITIARPVRLPPVLRLQARPHIQCTRHTQCTGGGGGG